MSKYYEYLKIVFWSSFILSLILILYFVGKQPDTTMNDLSPETRQEIKYDLLQNDTNY